jgi:hypothetical protein
MIQEESEDELEEDTPDIREVAHRREMSRAAQNPQRHMEQARDALGWTMNNATGDESRAVSEEGDIPATQQATQGLYRTASVSSTGSDFEDNDDMQDIWGHLLENERSSSYRDALGRCFIGSIEEIERIGSRWFGSSAREIGGEGESGTSSLSGW